MKKKWFAHKVAPWGLLAAGLLLAVMLASAQEALPVKPQTAIVPTVETLRVQRQDYQIQLKGFGALRPRETVRLMPQVSGRVIWQNALLEQGNYIEKGKPLFRIDDADYTIALNRAKAALEKAKKALEREKGQQLIAQQEWTLLDDEIRAQVKSPALALRKPQLASARADIAVAKSQHERATLDLARTQLSAPCNGVILQEDVAVGSLVTAGEGIISFACSEYYSVETAIPMGQLAYLDLPKAGTSRNGIMVRQGVASRKAILSALLPNVEPQAQMARLLIHVKDPLAHPPLLLNAHVEVEIPANKARGVFVIPQGALRADHTLWLLSPEQKLEIRRVSPLTTNQGQVLLQEGLSEGEKVIVSALGLPVAGMSLREVNP